MKMESLLVLLEEAVSHISAGLFGRGAPGLTVWEEDFTRRAHIAITIARGGTDNDIPINRSQLSKPIGEAEQASR